MGSGLSKCEVEDDTGCRTTEAQTHTLRDLTPYGAGVGVGASSFRTIPAGVRSDSIGVVSGVGAAGAGVAFSAPWPPLCDFEPQPAASAKSATNATTPDMRMSFTLLPLPNRGEFYR